MAELEREQTVGDALEPIHVIPVKAGVDERLYIKIDERMKASGKESHITLIALAAPCERSTLSEPVFFTSEGSSASNFILMSFHDFHRVNSSFSSRREEVSVPSLAFRAAGHQP